MRMAAVAEKDSNKQSEKPAEGNRYRPEYSPDETGRQELARQWLRVARSEETA
jgi:hypothetical protein